MFIRLIFLLVLIIDLTGIKLSPEDEEELTKKWQKALGPGSEVVVSNSSM